jgi:hypothetical protein
VRDPSALACLGKTPWEAVAPSGLFFVAPRRKPRGLLMKRHPERSEGSLGTYVPRKDIPKRRAERSEGCLAIARQDKKMDTRGDKEGWMTGPKDMLNFLI